MLTALITILALLQVKHWYIDFVNQSMEEVHSKGIYGDGAGIGHSAKHGFATTLCILIVTGYPFFLYALLLGFVDFVIHYHTDWAKMNYGNRDIQTPQFWNHLGLDQMIHQLTYLGIVYFVVA
jgi:hypothetical protein